MRCGVRRPDLLDAPRADRDSGPVQADHAERVGSCSWLGRKAQLLADEIRESFPDQCLVRNGVHRCDLPQRDDLRGIELDGDVLKPPVTRACEDMGTKPFRKGDLQRFRDDLGQDAPPIIEPLRAFRLLPSLCCHGTHPFRR